MMYSDILETNPLNKTTKFVYFKNIVLLLYVAVETLYKTILGMSLQVGLERLQCVLAIFLILCLVYEFFLLNYNERIKWCKSNVFVFAYFLVRLVTFIYTGMQYTVLRSLLFEVVYLLAITDILIQRKFCVNIMFKLFIIINFVLNFFNTFIFFYCRIIINSGLNSSLLLEDIANHTYIDLATQSFNSSMYSNPNIMGLMTGIALLLSFNYISKESKNIIKVFYILYVVFSLYCIVYSNCSNAHVALISIGVAFLIVKKVNIITRRRIVIICTICVLLVTGGIYVLAATNGEYDEYTKVENSINELSTQRYTIWKDSYYCHQDELWLGCGNITLEKRDRYQYIVDKGTDYGMDADGSLVEFMGPHNGYIGMLSCTGILGLLLFVALLLQRIREAEALNNGVWYLTIIFVLMINLFECMVPINKNFACLYLFMVLAMKDDNGAIEDTNNIRRE